MEQREISKNEHTQNIRSGLPLIKTLYGLNIDEFDYLDIAVDTLRDIRYFGTTEHIAYITVNRDFKAVLPCNMGTIDAVTTEHMGRKVFSTRKVIEVDGILDTDSYYSSIETRDNLGIEWNPGLGGITGKGYISYRLSGKSLIVSEDLVGKRIAVAYTGIIVDAEGFPIITRKQANAIAAICAKFIMLKGANRGEKGAASMIEYYSGLAGRLKQAASIPEEITDNEMDEILNVKTSFNRKTHNRPTKYSR
jgi:hypothetical protein